MGCSSCGQRAKAATTYPRTVVLADGSSVEVTSAADERAQRSQATERLRVRSQEIGRAHV